MRNVVIATHTQSVVTESDDVGEDGSAEEFDQPLKVPSVTSISGAIGLATQLAEFADWHGNEELSAAVSRMSDVLFDLKLKSLTQSSINDYLTK